MTGKLVFRKAAFLAIWLTTSLPSMACHTAEPATRPSGLEPGGTVITRSQIEDMKVRTALEVIERGARHLVIQRTREGSPLRIYHRGVNSFSLNTEVQVVVDGLLVNDGVEALRNIPTSSIENVQILSAREGTTRFGATAGGGLILVNTTAKGTPSPLKSHRLCPE